MQTPLKESPQRWWLALLLVAGMIFCYAQRGALSVAAPFMIQELKLSRAVMGVLLSAFFWTYSFMQVPAGWVVDRIGVKRAYAFGYAIWSAASVLTGFARTLGTLVAVRMMLGVGQAAAFPASARAVSNWFQERERGTVSAGYLTGVRLGQAMISAAGGLYLAVYGFQSFFVVSGLVPMLWVLPWWRFLGKWEQDEPLQTSVAGKNRFSFLESLGLFRFRSVVGIFLGFFAYDYAWFVYVNWLPTYLMMERKFSASEMGLYSSVPYLAMSVTILSSGVLSDVLIRKGYFEITVRRVLIVIGMVIACSIVPAGLVEDKMTAVGLLTVSLCGLGIASPNCWALTQAVCSKTVVGTVSGIQNFGGNVGGIIAPALTGYIAHTTGSFALALSVTGGILIFGVFCYWLMVRETVEFG